MWIVELNVLGHRFTRGMPDRRSVLAFRPRAVHARLSNLRSPRAAA